MGHVGLQQVRAGPLPVCLWNTVDVIDLAAVMVVVAVAAAAFALLMPSQARFRRRIRARNWKLTTTGRIDFGGRKLKHRLCCLLQTNLLCWLVCKHTSGHAI